MADHLNKPKLKDLEKTIKKKLGFDFIVICLEASDFRQVFCKIGPHLHGNQAIIFATRGCEPETGDLISQVIRQESCCRKIGALIPFSV